MQKRFMLRLNLARSIANIPFVINSGYRTPEHNKREGGTPDSSHIKGYAADIKVTDSRSRAIILDALFKAGFDRIGINFEKGFIHVDSDPNKPPNVVWGY